jgi:hypothetical protein
MTPTPSDGFQWPADWEPIARQRTAGTLTPAPGRPVMRLLALLAALFAGRLVAAPVPKVQAEEVFLVQDKSVPVLVTAGGEVIEERAGTNASLSPDRKLVESLERVNGAPASAKWIGVIRDRAGEEVHQFKMVYGTIGSGAWFVWSPKSDRVLIGEDAGKGPVFRCYDLAAKEVADVRVADGFTPLCFSPDGKRLFAGGGGRVAYLPPDGKGEPEYLTAEADGVGGGKLSPDGGRVLYRAKVETKYKGAEYQLFVFDLKAKKRTRVTADDGVPDSFAWSPDGRRVGYTWRQAFEDPDPVTKCTTTLVTAAADGTDRREVLTRSVEGKDAARRLSFSLCDWR